jgi:flagellar biosynthesis protein FliR
MDLSTVVRFALLLVRPGMVVMVAPALGGTYAPMPIKIALTILLAVTLAPSVTIPIATNDVALALFVVREAVIGLAIALAVQVLIATAELAGHLTGFQIGFSHGAMIDPVSGVRNPVVASLYGLLTLLSFFAINGHHEVLRALVASYAQLPIGAGHINASILTSVREFLGIIFTVGTRLAAPVVVVLLIVELAVGLISRSAPALHFMIIGYPVRLIVGLTVLAMMVATVPAVMNSVVSRVLGIGLDLAAAFK